MGWGRANEYLLLLGSEENTRTIAEPVTLDTHEHMTHFKSIRSKAALGKKKKRRGKGEICTKAIPGRINGTGKK